MMMLRVTRERNYVLLFRVKVLMHLSLSLLTIEWGEQKESIWSVNIMCNLFRVIKDLIIRADNDLLNRVQRKKKCYINIDVMHESR